MSISNSFIPVFTISSVGEHNFCDLLKLGYITYISRTFVLICYNTNLLAFRNNIDHNTGGDWYFAFASHFEIFQFVFKFE